MILVQDLRGQTLNRYRALPGSAMGGQRGQEVGNIGKRISSEGLEGGNIRAKFSRSKE